MGETAEHQSFVNILRGLALTGEMLLSIHPIGEDRCKVAILGRRCAIFAQTQHDSLEQLVANPAVLSGFGDFGFARSLDYVAHHDPLDAQEPTVIRAFPKTVPRTVADPPGSTLRSFMQPPSKIRLPPFTKTFPETTPLTYRSGRRIRRSVQRLPDSSRMRAAPTIEFDT